VFERIGFIVFGIGAWFGLHGFRAFERILYTNHFEAINNSIFLYASVSLYGQI
jgi:hypothetical protein